MSSLEPRVPLNASPSFPGFAQALGLLLLAAVLGLAAVLVFQVSGVFRGSGSESVFDGWTLIGVNSVAFLGASLIGWRRSGRPFAGVFPLGAFSPKVVPPVLVLAPATLIVLNWVSASFLELVPGEGAEAWMEEVFQELMALLLRNRPAAFAAVVVMAPLTEEVFFRGLLLQGFLRRYTPGKAIWATTFLFALAHFNPAQLPATVALGAYLGWLTHRTRSLWPALLAHAANNFLALGITWSLGADEVEALGSGTWTLNLLGAATIVVGGVWLWRTLPSIHPR